MRDWWNWLLDYLPPLLVALAMVFIAAFLVGFVVWLIVDLV